MLSFTEELFEKNLKATSYFKQCVEDVINHDLTDEQLVNVFNMLTTETQRLAYTWGMSDNILMNHVEYELTQLDLSKILED